MKNADRINFYLAGLRQATEGIATDGQAGAARGPASTDRPTASAASQAKSSESSSSTSDTLQSTDILPSVLSASVAGSAMKNTAPNGQPERPVAVPDQMRLHQLLQQLETRRQRSSGREDLSPEAIRKHRRQLILGLVLAGIIIAAQATAVVWLYQRAELLLGRPLSPALLLTAAAGDIDVTFRPSASAGDVAVLLRELDLQVVDGPDMGSRYVLRPEQNKDSKRDLNALRDRRDLVYSADAAY